MSEANRQVDALGSQSQNSSQTHSETESSGASRLTPPTNDESDAHCDATSKIDTSEHTPPPDSSSSIQSEHIQHTDEMSLDVQNGANSASESTTNKSSTETPPQAIGESLISEQPAVKQPFSEADGKKENEASSKHSEELMALTVQLPDKSSDDAVKTEPEQLEVDLPPPKLPANTEVTGACSSDSSNGSNSRNDNSVKDSAESVYHIKWINFKNKQVPIITQNENGPCPLLAIMNVLLLQNRVKLPLQSEFISASQLMAHLGECVFDNVPNPEEGVATPTRLNFEQNMGDAMAVMHKLQTGLDVNVRFTGVREFEYTSECIIFDLLQISLYHGWLVDPQTPPEAEAVGKCTYNQLVEKIISDKTSDKSEVVSQALVAEQFLESSASQLTYHGLCELASQLKEDELVVLFRNNHFTTLYRTKNELFQLVTDQGFLAENNVVWETLSNVEGDCHFVDSEFRTYTKQELPPVQVSNVPLNTDEQIDQDYLVALSLQQEQQTSTSSAWTPPTNTQHMSDLELARSLQEEERRAALEQANQEERQMQQHGSRPSPSHSLPRNRNQRPEYREREREREEKKSDCCIL